MKRWIVRILICLILGCVTTVAVAWGLAITTHPLRVGSPDDVRDMIAVQNGEVMLVTRTDVCGVSLIIADKSTYKGDFEHAANYKSRFTIDELLHPVATRVDLAHHSTHEFWLFGWPKQSLTMENWYTSGTAVYAFAWKTPFPPFVSTVRPAEPRRVPLRPIWPGFPIDTLFYGSIWFGIFFGFASARRALRRRRGRCPKCGYDLRGQMAEVSGQMSEISKGCPECGWNRE